MKDIAISSFPKNSPEIDPVQRDQELRKACHDFEAIFTYQLLKSMRRTIDKCDLFHGGHSEEIYESLLDQELAKKMAGAGRNSLAELLYQQLRNPSGLSEILETQFREPAITNFQTFQWPVKSAISSNFGWRKDPLTGQQRFHQGIDLAAEAGTPVKAALPGRVTYSDYQQGYGNVVVLDHGHGLTTLYAHNKKNLVRTGDWVRGGGQLARVGSSGRSTGPHLHFEIRKNGEHLDPLIYLDQNQRDDKQWAALSRPEER